MHFNFDNDGANQENSVHVAIPISNHKIKSQVFDRC